MNIRGGPRRAAFFVLATAALVFGYSVAVNKPQSSSLPGIRSSAPAEQQATPTDDPEIVPIFTEGDAIQRSVDRFPVGHNPNGELARLVSVETYETWGGFSVFSDWGPGIPVWVVGILGDDLHLSDLGVVPGVSITNPKPVDGAYYAWDANSGTLMGHGELDADRYSRLQSLPNEGLVVVRATAMPPVPTIDPTFIP